MVGEVGVEEQERAEPVMRRDDSKRVMVSKAAVRSRRMRMERRGEGCL